MVAGIRGPVKQRYLFIDAAVLGSRELVQLVLDVQETPAHVQVGAVLRVDAVEEPKCTRNGLRAFQCVSLRQQDETRPPVDDGAEDGVAEALNRLHVLPPPPPPPPLPPNIITAANPKAAALCKFWVRGGGCGTPGCTYRHQSQSDTEQVCNPCRHTQRKPYETLFGPLTGRSP